MREERRIVTALFADVVKSTELAERVDTEEARLILNETIAGVIAAIERYGGTIKDLAGDGVFALFGAPVAHEDDGERALHAALEIIDVGALKGRELEQGWGFEGFAIRVGIHTGEAVLGPVGAGGRVEYGAVGDPINTAARLEAQAAPGTVFVSDATRRLAGARFRWADGSELKLRGKSERVVAHRLIGPAAATTSTGLSSSPLSGRDPELRGGREALEALVRGQGSVLFVSGDPGIGKSRLIGELREIAALSATPWHEGRCVSYGESMPYWPFKELLRDLFGLGPRDPQIRLRVALQRQLRDLFGDRQLEVAPYLANLLGVALDLEDAANMDQLSPESRQFRTFEIIGDLMSRLTGKRPLVLVLEDLHWADPSSIQLTERLLPIVESLPVLLIISHRSERDHGSWTLRETAAREYPHIYREVNLKPLAAEDQDALLVALVGDTDLPTPAREALLRYAEGNPFFVEQLVRSLHESQALGHAPEATMLEIPSTIEELILARVDRLSEVTRAVLTAATPLGRSFGISLLEAVSDHSPEEVRTSLHELRRCDLLHEERRWPEPEHRFTHALIQESLYRTILLPRRRALHARAATWLEERHADHLDEVSSLLAHHWRAAEDGARAIRFLELAGDRARELWALDEAITHYWDLVALLEAAGRDSAAAETLFKLGLTLHTAMRYREANEVWQRAFATRPKPEPVSAPASALLRIASFPIPISADPHRTIRWSDIQLGMELNDRLVEARPNFNLVPSLAESWEVSDDGLRYRFRLREDAAWNDGRPLRASEIEQAIRHRLDPGDPGDGASIFFCLENASEYFHGVKTDPALIGVHAIDGRTLEFRLAAPAPYFMNVLNRPDANAAGVDGIGSGAFELAELDEEHVRLRRAPGHRRQGAGNVDEVQWVAIRPPEAALAFERDEFDLLLVRYGPVPAALAAAQQSSDLLPATTSVFVVFDCAQLGADIHLRRALALGLDRSRLSGLPGARGMIAVGGLVPPALPGHTPDIALRFDPDGARLEFGASPKPEMVRVGTLEAWVDIAREVIACWSEVLGVEFRLEVHEHAGAAFRDGCAAMVYNWLPGYPDADYYLRLLLHSQSRTNFASWKNEAFDRLIEESRLKTTAAARLALFHEADRLAVQVECPVIPLLYYRPFVLAKPWVRGYWEWGKSAASFADLVVETSSPTPVPATIMEAAES